MSGGLAVPASNWVVHFMLKQRLLTAALLTLVLTATVFFASRLLWWLLTLGITALAAKEWGGLAGLNNQGRQWFSIITLMLGVFLLPGLWLNNLALQAALLCMGLAVLFWVLAAPGLLGGLYTMPARLVAPLGIVILLAFWWALGVLRDTGTAWLLSIIATVAIADSAAYFSGKRFGRYKLAPAISPGKTWEGVAGAWLGVTLFWAGLHWVYGFNAWLLVIFWIILILSIFGDLFESLLKRRVGLKDSGNLLPGHGGILDRIDGLLPVLPFVVILMSVFDFSLIHG